KYNLQAGLLASGFRSRKFKEVADLLGATFWIDIDQFAEGLGVEEYIQQNDLDNPNKKVKEKDRFGYDYTVNLQKADLWCNAEYRFRRTDVFAGIAGSITD